MTAAPVTRPWARSASAVSARSNGYATVVVRIGISCGQRQERLAVRARVGGDAAQLPLLEQLVGITQ